jgi:hypothetical protein
MLTELATKEQQYKQETSSFLDAAACPATPSKTEQDITTTCLAAATAWTTMRVQPHAMKLRCRYTIKTGAAATNPSTTAPLSAATWVTNVPTSQAESWFYILAECDANGNGTYAQFFQSSWDTRIQKYNEGE